LGENTESQHISAVENMVSVDRISLNMSQSVIVTTEDKIRLCLELYLKNINKRRDFIAPLSLLIAIVATLVTANFQDFFLDAATWKAMFVITGLVSIVWLIRSIMSLKDKTSIDDLIENIKSGNTYINTDQTDSGDK